MSVTIRDVNTNEEIIIPPEGLIFGRTGGDADIQLDDNSISRRQARVSLKGGNWLVETIAVAQGQRPPRPVTLVEGQTFIVGQNEFEVVSIAESEEADEPAPPPAKAAKPAAKAAPPSRAPTMKTAPAAAPAARKAAPAAAAKKPAPKAAEEDEEGSDAGDEGSSEGGDAVPSKGFGSMFVAVPKGIAYYMVNVPKMLFNPIGTVRKGIDEQPAEPMAKIELIGYALPALVVSSVLSAWGFAFGRLIGPGHYFELMSFIPIFPLISAVISAIVIGFVFHPVMEWIIRKLQGESDARSRTNYFLQLQTVTILMAVPSFFGQVLTATGIPFIYLLGPLLSAAASLVLTYVMYQWILSFNMIKWVKFLVLAGGAITVVFAVIGLITGIISSVRSLGSHSSSSDSAEVAAASGDADDAAAKAIAEAEKAAEAAGPEAAEAFKANKAAMIAAQKQAAAAMAAANAAGAEAAEKAEKAEKAANEKAEKAEKAAAEKAEKAEKAMEKKAVAADPAPPVAEDPPPAAKVEPKAPPAAKSGSYADFARKREGIEHTLAADPTVLDGNSALQEAYGEYLKDSNEIEKKYQKDIAKNANKARLYEHLRDAELYKELKGQVDSLAGKLKVH